MRVCALLALLFATGTACAQDADDRLEWSPHWARVHPAAYATVGGLSAFALIFDHLYDGGPEAQLRGPTIIDSPVRRALMATTDEGRRLASTISDALLVTLISWPLFDAAVVAGIADTNSDVFWQLTWIAAESYSLELLINTVMKQLVARERPHGSRCTLEDRLEDPVRCGPSGRLRSFYSGHSSFSFSAAGLVCVTHTHLPLYGNDIADGVACGVALALATTVATLRIVADRHYLTDVLVGALVGLTTGLVMPYLLHFVWDPSPDVGTVSVPVASAPPTFSIGGVF